MSRCAALEKCLEPNDWSDGVLEFPLRNILVEIKAYWTINFLLSRTSVREAVYRKLPDILVIP